MTYPKKLLIIILCYMAVCSCKSDDPSQSIPELDFRQEMRLFVQDISTYAKAIKNDFLIIPQNGQEILVVEGQPAGTVSSAYINAIDGVGREDLFYGYTGDDIATPNEDRDFLLGISDVAKDNGKVVLVTDYCSTQSKMDDSYVKNQNKGYISFAADHRELDNIPTYPSSINNVNSNNITSLNEVKNFLYLINSAAYPNKQSFLEAIQATNYDLVLIDLFFNDEQLSISDIKSLKTKLNGGSRLVICYMSIGESEDYRYYWAGLNKDLNYRANPDWPGNYAVRYWEPAWKEIIYGNDQSYTKKILDVGFDGVYLDIIEAYEYFEY